MEGKKNKYNKLRLGKKWKGFRRYLYKIIRFNILLVLIPICILGILWYSTVSNQAEKKFHQQKSIEMNEVVTGIKQRIKTIMLEVAVEKSDKKYSTYTISNEYSSDLLEISNRLSAMIEKYDLLHSVYFYDKTTGRIYNSKSGSYIFESFYDKKWLNDTKDIYSVQQLPLRYTFDDEVLLNKYNALYNEYNKLVLSLVIKGRPDFYLIANISINRLFNDIADTYELNHDNQEFFFLDTSGQLIEGKCEYIKPESLFQMSSKLNEKEVSYIKYNNRIYFMKSLSCGIACVTSYPIGVSYEEARYLGNYILLVCIGLLIFLLIISTYMAKKLYQPINTLYSEIAVSAKNLEKENVYDEIDMLKQVFSEMNTFNSNAKLNLKQFDEISKTFRFRNFLEHYQCQKDFLQDHPYLFDESGNRLCEMLLLKFDDSDMGMSIDEEMLFRLNLQEVLRTYLQSSMKGILTKIEDDNLVLLYLGTEKESVDQTRKVLTDTVTKLTNQNVYFAVSQPIHKAEEIIPQFHICLDLIQNSFFFNWKNEIITTDRTAKVKDNDDIYNMLLNINTSIIRNIASQNEPGIDNTLIQLEAELHTIQNASQVKDVCSRIMVDLDNEFHFSRFIDGSLLQTLNDNKTLADMMQYIKKLLRQVSCQYGKNDTKENNYCELAKSYLDENYVRDMNITDVADHLDISYSYLSKIFRTRTGITLTDYLNTVRIEKSKEYLANTFLTLFEISEKVGYNNVQSYQRFFKKYVNITPGDYRKLYNK